MTERVPSSATADRPKLIAKRQTTLGEGLDNRILSLYGKGLSYEDIQGHLEDLYGLEISTGQLSAITDKILPIVEQWRSRPLEAVYAFVWLDAVHFKVRQDGKVVSKAAYNVLAVDLQGNKDLLGIYIGDAESARFWLSVLTDLQNRGVKDLLICSIDNLTGFGDAIETVFPQADVQLCLVHQVRTSMRYVVSKDQKAVAADLRPIYQSANLSGAEQKLADFEEKWGSKYPLVVESWKRNWLRLTRFFEYPASIRKVVYTTNTVESFHKQIRCVTKSKPGGRSRSFFFRNSPSQTALFDYTEDHGKVENARAELGCHLAATHNCIRGTGSKSHPNLRNDTLH